MRLLILICLNLLNFSLSFIHRSVHNENAEIFSKAIGNILENIPKAQNIALQDHSKQIHHLHNDIIERILIDLNGSSPIKFINNLNMPSDDQHFNIFLMDEVNFTELINEIFYSKCM